MEFFVDCSANATPEFEGRGGEALSTEMSRTLAHAYNDRKVFDLKSLAILPGKHCWLLYVDILVITLYLVINVIIYKTISSGNVIEFI